MGRPVTASASAPSDVAWATPYRLPKNLAAWVVFSFVMLWIIPAIFFISKVFFGSEITALTSSEFFKALNMAFAREVLRSLVFTVAQSSISTVVVMILAAISGICFVQMPCALYSRITPWLRLSAHIVFFLPSTAIALVVLVLAQNQSVIPSYGIWAIVFAHVLFLFPYFSIQAIEHLRVAWGLRMGSQYELLQTLGAKPRYALRILLWDSLRDFFQHWAPLAFLWSFTSFSIVVILGGGPEASSIEVLIYYYLMNDTPQLRLFVLVGVQVFFASQVARLQTHSQTTPARSISISAHERSLRQPAITAMALFQGLVIVAPLCIVLYHLNPFRVIGSLVEFPWMALQHTLFYSLATFGWTVALAMAFVFLLGFPLRAAYKRSKLTWALGISPVVLVALWLQVPGFSGFEGWSDPLVYATSGLLLTLALSPSLLMILRSHMEQIPLELDAQMMTLGSTGWRHFRHVHLPFLARSFKTLSLFSVLAAFGDIAISAAVMPHLPNLALFGQRQAARYDFGGAELNLTLMLLLSLGLIILLYRRQDHD